MSTAKNTSPSATRTAASGPLDDFWMTPAMGLRMHFDFAKSVIEMSEATEKKRRAAEERAAQKAPEKVKTETSPAPVNIPPEISFPPPPPLRVLRY
jgi:hypothetical protein